MARHVVEALADPPSVRDTAERVSDIDLAVALAEVALRLAGAGSGRSAVMEAVLREALTCLPGFDHAAVALVGRKRAWQTTAASSDTARTLDDLQRRRGPGPHADIMDGATMVCARTIRHEQRWPEYVRAAVSTTPLRSHLAVGLGLRGESTPFGVLNLYSTTHDHIDERTMLTAHLFAGHAAVALRSADRVHQLTTALETRTLIGQAVGLLMSQHEMSAEAAFSYLTRTSSHSNVKVRDIARDVVLHRGLPAAAPGPERPTAPLTLVESSPSRARDHQEPAVRRRADC